MGQKNGGMVKKIIRYSDFLQALMDAAAKKILKGPLPFSSEHCDPTPKKEVTSLDVWHGLKTICENLKNETGVDFNTGKMFLQYTCIPLTDVVFLLFQMAFAMYNKEREMKEGVPSAKYVKEFSQQPALFITFLLSFNDSLCNGKNFFQTLKEYRNVMCYLTELPREELEGLVLDAWLGLYGNNTN